MSISLLISKYKRRKEKAVKGYDYLDLWNMDLYLLDLFSKMLKELSKTTISYPAGMTLKEWQKYLVTMADDFSDIRKKTEFGVASRSVKKEFEEVMKRFTEHFFDLWD